MNVWVSLSSQGLTRCAVGNESAVKAAGKMRTEGKSYEVEDGDIMFFKVRESPQLIVRYNGELMSECCSSTCPRASEGGSAVVTSWAKIRMHVPQSQANADHHVEAHARMRSSLSIVALASMSMAVHAQLTLPQAAFAVTVEAAHRDPAQPGIRQMVTSLAMQGKHSSQPAAPLH